MTPAHPRPGYFAIAARPGAIPELDGLRGIAILLVLLRHAARPIHAEHGGILQVGSWDIAVPLLNGWMGVDLFFVLSGFLITHHLLMRWPERLGAGFLLRYWLKRVLRTFPAYYATLFIVAAGVLPFYRPQVADLTGEVAHHVIFLQDYLGSELVPAFWSLGVEEKFYLLCPFILWWLGVYPRMRQIRILTALALLPLLLRAMTLALNAGVVVDYASFFWTVRSPFHLALDGLWLGVMCALACRWRPAALTGDAANRHRLLFAGIALIALLQSAVAWFDAGHFRASVIVLSLVPLGFAAIVLAVASGTTAASRVLRTRWLRFLAVTSYSVYLTHMLMVPVAEGLVGSVESFGQASPPVQFLLFLPVFVALSLLAGLALHLAVEKPFLLLKDRVQLH